MGNSETPPKKNNKDRGANHTVVQVKASTAVCVRGVLWRWFLVLHYLFSGKRYPHVIVGHREDDSR